MRIGVVAREMLSWGSRTARPVRVDDLVAEAIRVQADGLAAYWLLQQLDLDVLTVAPTLGLAASDIEIGAMVVPMQMRFPLLMAQAAATVRAVAGGRFALGIGVEHELAARHMWGLPFERPVSELEEYLEIVLSLLRKGSVDFQGEFFTVRSGFQRLPPAPDMPVILGALGRRMLTLAGTRADGTTTWLAGTRTVREHVVPTINQAASEAGRPAPRVIVQLPIGVTRKPAALRADINTAFDLFPRIGSYRRTLAKQGAVAPADVAIIGNYDEVLEQLAELAAAGATDFGGIIFGLDEAEEEATWAALREASGTLSNAGPAT